MCKCMCTLYNDQIRVVGLFTTSNLYHFFVLMTFKILFSSYLEIYNELLLAIITYYVIEHQKFFFLADYTFATIDHPLLLPQAPHSSQLPVTTILVSTSLRATFLDATYE